MSTQLDAGVEQRFRRVALIVSTSVWTWAESAQLGIVEGHVLLALSASEHPVDAIEIAVRSQLSLDAVYPALNRLTGRGYAREEHRRHGLTNSGRRLVADFDRAEPQVGPDELRRLESALGSVL